MVAGAFLFFYNYALRPITNSIIWIVTTLNNVVARIVNAIIAAINAIPFVSVGGHMSYMNYSSYALGEISMDDLNNEGSSYIEGQGGSVGYSTSGQGASYSQARDIYLTFNIDYQVGVSAFDDNDLAVKIYNQIERSKKLGLIA
jgi:hypothetical protein